MPSILIDFAAIWAMIAIWTALGRYAAGRVVQAAITALVYAAWLSIIPLGIYFIGTDIAEALDADNYGKAIFIAFASLLMLPVFVLPLVVWNYFCAYVWRKTGLRLPQLGKLGGEHTYYDWERER